MIILFLTCADNDEAQKIRNILLGKRLIACGGIIKIDHSKYWWLKKYEEAKNESLLIMESKQENFQKIEKEVRKIHKHKVFVLLSFSIKTTKGVIEWLKKELK